MKGKLLVRIAAALGVAGTVTAVTYAGFLRPWLKNWGATAAEIQRSMPGDDVIPRPDWISTRAITINAPIERVWPWLAQIGYKRAGWYSYDFIHNVLGCAGSVDDPNNSASRIIPELQDIKQGDVIKIMETGPLEVTDVEPQRLLLLASPRDAATGEIAAGGMTWAWQLEQVDANTTRLIVRTRGFYGDSFLLRALYRVLIEPGGFVMEQRTMRGIKERAEAGA